MAIPEAEQGMILPGVMVFLAGISWLVLNLLESSLLEAKMSNYYQNKVNAFYQAEDLLLQWEQSILAGERFPKGTVVVSSVAGILFCRIVVPKEFQGVRSKLQSIVAVPEDSALYTSRPEVTLGRQSFLVLE